MTIAIAIKVTDGLVLAADSATTIGGGEISNVYNNAEKVFNLHKEAHLGTVMWGLGNIRNQTVAALLKDLRYRFTSGDKNWKLDLAKYSVSDVAKRVQQFLYSEVYRPWCEESKDFPKEKWPYFGMLIGGYSPKANMSEVWRLEFDNGDAVLKETSSTDFITSIQWGGDAQAVHRLVLGYDGRLPEPLVEAVAKQAGVEPADIQPIIREQLGKVEASILPAWMPIQDAIDLSHFLVDTAAKFSRYTPGHQTIGGPIDIAVITKHEGFKWVRRKHYYDRALNLKT